MSIDENNEERFLIVFLGTNSGKNKPKLDYTDEFLDLHQLKTYLNDKKESSIILILSNEISFESLDLNEYSQICAVFNSDLVCLYCLSTQSSSVNHYLKESQTQKEKASKRLCPPFLLSFIEKNWFLIGLVLALFIAYLFPNVGKTRGYIHAEWTIKWGCVMLIFFLSGLSVQPKEFLKEFLHIRLHLFVQIFSLFIIPFSVYGISLLLAKTSFNKTLIISIIIIGSTCTTISSNVIMTKNATGNEYAALLNAVLGNTLGIFISPILIFYLTKNSVFNFSSNSMNTSKQLDYIKVVKNLSITVLIPLIIGQILHLIWPKQVTYIRQKFHFNKLNSFVLLVLVWAMFCDVVAANTFQIINKIDFILVSLIDAAIYVGFSSLIMLIARLPIQFWQYSKSDTIAMMFCGASKSLAMGISLMNAFYENEKLISLLSLPFIIYHIEQLIFGAIWVTLLKKWAQTQPTEDHTMNISLNEIEA